MPFDRLPSCGKMSPLEGGRARCRRKGGIDARREVGRDGAHFAENLSRLHWAM